MLYGISRRGVDGNSERILWWESTEHRQHETFVRVSFHYHTVSIDLQNRYMILDGSCGDDNGTLIAYDVSKKQCVGFQSGTRLF
jgi:hypothetical protein